MLPFCLGDLAAYYGLGTRCDARAGPVDMEFSLVRQELFRGIHNWLFVSPRHAALDDGDGEQAGTFAGPAVGAAPIAMT